MRNKGFTLVEILIVVIILGILAAIVIPQFTQASDDARESTLVTDLQTLRSQLELYKVQHLENYPPTSSSAAFITNLTTKTDMTGAAGGNLGPYFNTMPTNPFNNLSDVGFGTDPCPGDNATGWYFETDIGKMSPNDNVKAAHKDL